MDMGIRLSQEDQDLFMLWLRFKHQEEMDRLRTLSDFMVSGIQQARIKDDLFWDYYEQRYGIKRVDH